MGTHPRRTLQDAFLQHADRTRANIVNGEVLLRGRDLANGFIQRALLRRAAIEDAGLVEMDVRLDETRSHEPAIDIDGLRLARQAGLNRGDLPTGDPDVDLPLFASAERCRVLEDQIHQRPPPR